MRFQRPRTSVLLFFGVGLVLVGAYYYLFRTIEDDNPYYGIIESHYFMGFPKSRTGDTNRDGFVDIKFVYFGEDVCFGRSFHHLDSSEGWRDIDFDGFFETYIIVKRGKVIYLEVDADENGSYDQILTGDEAVSRYEEMLQEPASLRERKPSQ